MSSSIMMVSLRVPDHVMDDCRDYYTALGLDVNSSDVDIGHKMLKRIILPCQSFLLEIVESGKADEYLTPPAVIGIRTDLSQDEAFRELGRRGFQAHKTNYDGLPGISSVDPGGIKLMIRTN